MSRVFVHLGVSLDGIIAGSNRGPNNPMGGVSQLLHSWVWPQRAFRRALALGENGETGPDNDRVERTMNRIGANIMGKRMFEEGEASWPEDAPFHCPVFVLTHEKREPWKRKGGTTFYFVNDGIESVLEQAKRAAGSKDVRISGGKDVVLQYLAAGLVDELSLSLAPVFLGQGLRLFDAEGLRGLSLEIEEAAHSPRVTHLRYAVTKKR
jgi:dihydrofolate reductase